MTAGSVVLFTFLFALGYLIAPVMLVWGWVRWIKQRPRMWTITSTLSFTGFLLATVSALFGVWMIVFPSGGFITRNHLEDYGLFYRFCRWGIDLSLLGAAFAMGGMWRRGATRWQAPPAAAGTIAFWLLATTWP